MIERFKVVFLASNGRMDEAAAYLQKMIDDPDGKKNNRYIESIRELAERLELRLSK